MKNRTVKQNLKVVLMMALVVIAAALALAAAAAVVVVVVVVYVHNGVVKIPTVYCVCEQDNSKGCVRIWIKFRGVIGW